MADGRVEFEITADGRKAYASIDQVTDELKKAGIKWESNAKQATDQIGNSFSGMLKKIVTGISAAAIGKMILNIGKDAIQAASDLEEVQNVVDVTFGETGAKKIEAWAKAAGEQFGLTETQAKRFTSTLGAMMKSAGMSGDEITEMSADLAGLAADMASFYNLDLDTAFQKIRSGISGETEPLKQLGINMSEANLQAFALQQGLTKTFSEMTQGEKTILRYQYLMQATADAQGDFARTSDGFANATRMLETNIESLKTKLGKVLLPVVNDVISGINAMFDAMTKEPERTVIDDFNDIEVDTAGKMQKLNETYNKAQDIINLLAEIGSSTVTLNNGSSMTFEELFKNLAEIEKSGGDTRAYLEELGLDADFVGQKYQVWKAAAKELTQLIPEMNESINAQTGEIDGGTAALQKNLDEWRSYQEKKIAWAEYYAKEEALARKKGEMFAYELDAGAARQAVKRQQETLDKLRQELGIDGEGYDMIVRMNATGGQGVLSQQEQQWNDAIVTLGQLRAAEQAAVDEWERQTTDYSEAEQKLADTKEYMISKYGEEEQAIKETVLALNEWSDEQKKAATEAVEAFGDALKAVEDYRDEVREATRQSVEGNIGGFRQMKTAAQQAEEAANAYKELEESLREAGVSGEEFRSKMDAANEQITAQSMTQALKSQLDFINEYKQNIEDIKKTGLIDEEILAQLSDGSQESAQYLFAMAEAARTGDKAGLEELNKTWKEVNKEKGTFVDALTEQKLAVDEQYDAMVKKAEEAAAALDVSETAGQSTGNNITAMANAIKEHVPEVAEQVDAVLAELNRLNAWGVNLNLGGGYGASIANLFGSAIGGAVDGSFATGLNYVPFDGFLAQLHEGEGILTAEENRVWQAFKNGQRGVDYETLGGVMRDSIKPGGNVYLDGRQVGQVVSDMQGNQYRTMQRSGFQQ